jgi:hypothetical protein
MQALPRPMSEKRWSLVDRLVDLVAEQIAHFECRSLFGVATPGIQYLLTLWLSPSSGINFSVALLAVLRSPSHHPSLYPPDHFQELSLTFAFPPLLHLEVLPIQLHQPDLSTAANLIGSQPSSNNRSSSRKNVSHHHLQR